MVQENFVGQRRDSGEDVVFPVEFSNADDASKNWRWDAEHSPFPLTPLAQEFGRGMGGPAMAAESLGAAPAPPPGRVIANGYRYTEARGPGGGGFGSQEPAYIKTVAAMAPRVEELWDRGWRLEIEDRGREIAAYDYGALTLSDLTDRLIGMGEGVGENMVLMFRAAHLVTFSRGKLLEFCEAQIGEAAESLVTDLLQGTQTESLESGAALWDVAQVLGQNADVLEHLRRQPDSEGLTSLSKIEGSGDFLARFDDWLTKYGHRNGSFGELAEPTWYEDPGVALGLALQYVGVDDPRLGQQRAIKVRELVQEEFEKRLKDVELVKSFRELLALAEPYLGVRESRDHATNMALTAIRVPALILGQRLVESNVIVDPADIFFLRFDELKAAAAGSAGDLRGLVEERRKLYVYWRDVAPPVTIGAPDPREVDQRYVRGVSASQGVATGTARVIMSLSDAARLEAGDILVTRGTTPAWTPLFGSVAAVVTEGGGTLSHCAIIAREYGIPAVVGASNATLRIKDGDRVTVDGTKARVKIEELADGTTAENGAT